MVPLSTDLSSSMYHPIAGNGSRCYIRYVEIHLPGSLSDTVIVLSLDNCDDVPVRTRQAVHDPLRPFIQPSGPFLLLRFRVESSIFYHACQGIHDRHRIDVLGCALSVGLFIPGIEPVFQRFDGICRGFFGRSECCVLIREGRHENRGGQCPSQTYMVETGKRCYTMIFQFSTCNPGFWLHLPTPCVHSQPPQPLVSMIVPSSTAKSSVCILSSLLKRELTVQQELSGLVYDVDETIGHSSNKPFGQFNVE
jgi:hypothetical protein